MARDLGTKHACYSCGTKFYDLHRPDPICPKCGADQRESPVHAVPPEKRRHAKPAVAEPLEDSEVAAVAPDAADAEDEELEADEELAEEAADEEV
jgi:uncharacterized protein (TIGR02300 family)